MARLPRAHDRARRRHGSEDVGVAPRPLPPAPGASERRRHAQSRSGAPRAPSARLARGGARAARGRGARVRDRRRRDLRGGAAARRRARCSPRSTLEVDGDTFFPEWDRDAFVEVAREEHVRGRRHAVRVRDVRADTSRLGTTIPLVIDTTMERVEVGIRELRLNLSRYVARVRDRNRGHRHRPRRPRCPAQRRSTRRRHTTQRLDPRRASSRRRSGPKSKTLAASDPADRRRRRSSSEMVLEDRR